MKARAVRLHAANDLRLDTFELPEIRDDEILVKVVSDSICMSTYKCAILGTEHKRVHPDVAEHPAIMGHEFAGDIVKVAEVVRDLTRRDDQKKLSTGEKRMLTKARQILSSELALARDIDKTAAAARLDEVLAEGYDESLAIADDLPEEDTEQE